MSEQGLKGQQRPEDGAVEYNALAFLIRQIMSTMRTCTMVKVVKVTNTGGVSAVGFVDVQPLVNQQDGFGNAVPHGVLYGLPYSRLQGGANAVILDPVAGDIGIAVFADRDISVVKNTKKQASPGSARMSSMADGLYIGGVLNGVPTNYVQFSGNDINIKATGNVNVTSPHINLQNTGAALQTLLNSQLIPWLTSHTHPDPQGGTVGASATPLPTGISTTVLKAE